MKERKGMLFIRGQNGKTLSVVDDISRIIEKGASFHILSSVFNGALQFDSKKSTHLLAVFHF